jgi:hypothetical protein
MLDLQSDLNRIKTQAYHRAEWGSPWFKKFHRLKGRIQKHPQADLIAKLHRWLLSPITLWPTNLDSIGAHVLENIEVGKSLSPYVQTFLDLLPVPPAADAQAVTEQHEHHVQKGEYEHLIHASHKFNYREQELALHSEFKSEWQQIKKLFDIKRYQDHKKMIRRWFVTERSMRQDWEINWKKKDDRFHSIFNTFCLKWNLYGMEGDRPMLLKMTVNLTPYGTMIFVPAYWNFDPKRDLKWASITALHKARGTQKQGPKLGLNQIGRKEDAMRVKSLDEQARRKGLRGTARTDWIISQMGWHPATDPSKLKRLLKL